MAVRHPLDHPPVRPDLRAAGRGVGLAAGSQRQEPAGPDELPVDPGAVADRAGADAGDGRVQFRLVRLHAGDLGHRRLDGGHGGPDLAAARGASGPGRRHHRRAPVAGTGQSAGSRSHGAALEYGLRVRSRAGRVLRLSLRAVAGDHAGRLWPRPHLHPGTRAKDAVGADAVDGPAGAVLRHPGDQRLRRSAALGGAGRSAVDRVQLPERRQIPPRRWTMCWRRWACRWRCCRFWTG